MGTLRMLESIRACSLQNKTRFYQASTSELFGKVQEVPQKETTPFYPRSPYGVAKLYGFWIVKNYREAYDLHASSGILFNHESPRRGGTFVTKKITDGLRNIKEGTLASLELGNLNAKRDWGHAKDYVEGMWKMLQQDKPEDYVLATGKTSTIREFCELAFKELNIEIKWKGSGANEVGTDCLSGKEIIAIDSNYYRPTEVDLLVGDATKAKKLLNWEPKYNLNSLVSEMISSDLDQIKKSIS
jgi:GDPmannose 4,6-dehydratase